MKAAVVEGPGKLTVRELPQPEPGEYQALCQLLYGSVCPGTDNHLVKGDEPFNKWFKAPAVLGHESIGRVLKLGPKARKLKVGDLVTRVGTIPTAEVNVAWGGFAEYGIATDWMAMQDDGIPREKWNYLRSQQVLPAGVSPDQATMLITWRETYSYIARMGMKPGQNVLVVGSGGNGLAFANHARNLGAAKIIMLGNPSRAAVAAGVGAQLLDYRAGSHAAALKESVPGGFDMFIDSVGKGGVLDSVLPLLKVNGIIGVYGLDDINGYSLNVMHAKNTFTLYRGHYEEAEAHEPVVRFMQAGLLKASDYLTNLEHPFQLDQINQALESVRTRACIKALVKLAAKPA